ncbi:MAG TPA: DnaB-like helicase C-terminal domain-containing protein [Myxococcota bacterium]|nr:DnaB-like helicase C-terminal domain-containing protein [Myxococcota bacterium]
MWDLVANAIAADANLIRDRLPKSVAVSDDVLKGILDGSKKRDASVAGEYIKQLVAWDKRRRALEAGREYQALVEQGKVEAATDGLIRNVLDLFSNKRLVKVQHPEKIAASNLLTELERRQKSGKELLGLDTGFDHLNTVFNGLTEGVFILAGAPGLGKTTLAKQIADKVAEKEQVPVLFFTYEQTADDLRIKSLARLSKVRADAIMTGNASKEDWQKVQEADHQYRSGPGPYLTIIEADAQTTVATIRTAALMAKHRAGGDKRVLLVLDYLQITPTPPDVRLDGIKAAVDWNLSELRRLSRELRSPVLVISSMNRAAYKTAAGTGTRPTLAAMKESGGIEYTADGVICLWQDEAETDRLTKNKWKTVRIEALILKNRNGATKTIYLDFTPELADFVGYGQPKDLKYNAALGTE